MLAESPHIPEDNAASLEGDPQPGLAQRHVRDSTALIDQLVRQLTALVVLFHVA